MTRKGTILALLIIIIFATALYYFYTLYKAEDTDKTMISDNTQVRNSVIEIETHISLTHYMKMPFDEFVNKTESRIHPYYKETYFDELKKASKMGNLVFYINEPPYYRYVSKVYSSIDNTIKQVYVKFPVDSAINASTKTPVDGTKFQIAKLYTFKKENDQWKVFSVANYSLSIDRNEPKQIIERFANYNNTPIEYESIKILK
jgi:hypothetical protein